MHMRSYKDLNYNYQGVDLILDNRKLNSLDGCPEDITGDFDCSNNYLRSLVGGPQRVAGWYDAEHQNSSLTSLVGCASHIGHRLYFCGNDELTSLVGIHKIIKSCKIMTFDSENITEGGIGLLMINNLTEITDDAIQFHIIKQYLGSGTKGMMECSKELTAKGYSPYAKL